jgi:hypothetical protein
MEKRGRANPAPTQAGRNSRTIMSIHLEIAFEKEVCDHLGCHGWLYEDKTANHYDRKLALYPPDLIG